MAKSRNNPKKSIVKVIKKLSRLAQLERERMVGIARSKTFGGKPDIREERKTTKKRLKELDDREGDE